MSHFYSIMKKFVFLFMIQLIIAGTISAQKITVSPNNAYRGQKLTVTISGEGTTFGGDASCTCPTCRKISNNSTLFQQVTSTTIRIDFNGAPKFLSPTEFELNFQIPGDVYGSFDLAIAADQSCAIMVKNAFSIKAYDRGYDSLILVELFNAAGGQNWSNKTNWLSDQPINTWYGITLANNRVSEINLSSNNLSGNLPAIFQNMNGLEVLDFSRNQLSSTDIPKSGLPYKLKKLILNDNQFEGIIQNYFTSQYLIELNLGNNKYSGQIPPVLYNQTSLEFLSLSNNEFTDSLTSQIGKLKKLKRLELDGNKLSGVLPGKLGDLTELQVLLLNDNEFSGNVPASLSNLLNVRKLTLDNNNLTGFLADIKLMTTLDTITIDNNNLEFDDLEAIYQDLSKIPSFTLSNLDSIGPESKHYLNLGETLTLSVSCGGTNNSYQWYKDGTPVTESSESSSYTILNFDSTLAGNYICHIKNPAFTDITLYSNKNFIYLYDPNYVEESQIFKYQSIPQLLSITPNPANEVIELVYQVQREANVIIQIYNILGELIFENTKNSFGLEKFQCVLPNSIANGTYRVVCRTSYGFDGMMLNVIR